MRRGVGVKQPLILRLESRENKINHAKVCVRIGKGGKKPPAATTGLGLLF